MKKYIVFIAAIVFAISCKAQIVNIKNKNGTRSFGAYYKDVDNEMDQFVGTYKYVNGADELTIIFRKHVNCFNTEYYQDLLVGEIKFIKNGVLQFDNLHKINNNYPNKYLHDICGNTLIENGTRPVCSNCNPNQFRADLIFFGRSNNLSGFTILQKYIENGVEKIKVSIYYRGRTIMEGDPMPAPVIIPAGDYIMIKQ